MSSSNDGGVRIEVDERDEEDNSERSYRVRDGCCHDTTLVDNSEPCVWLLGAMGVMGLIAGFLQGSTICVIIGACLVLLGLISSWRIRVLGQAYAIMKSVHRLEMINDSLAATNDKLEIEIVRFRKTQTTMERQLREQEIQNTLLAEQVNTFQGIVGLLGENVTDIEQSTARLNEIYYKYKAENVRQTRNNLMQLFFIMDKDEDGVLTKEELTSMKHAVEEIRGHTMKQFDTDGDGEVSIQEFIDAVQ